MTISMEPQNNAYSVSERPELYIQKGSAVLKISVEKESNRKNIGVKPGKETVLGSCGNFQQRVLEPGSDKWHLPQQVVFIRLIKLQL